MIAELAGSPDEPSQSLAVEAQSPARDGASDRRASDLRAEAAARDAVAGPSAATRRASDPSAPAPPRARPPGIERRRHSNDEPLLEDFAGAREPDLIVSIVNLPYRGECGGFDGRVLESFFAERAVECAREYFYVVDGRPHLSCWLEWRARPPLPGAGEDDPAHTGAARDSPRRTRSRAPAEHEDLDPLSQQAFDALRAWRLARARELGLPAYRVLTNRVLARIARARPAERAALGQIEGVGASALEAWASGVLEVLSRLPAAALVRPASSAAG